MDPIILYLESGEIPEDKVKARRLKYQAAQFTIIDKVLYKRGFSLPYLRCLDVEEARYVLEKIHEGVCDNHTVGRYLAHKVIRQDYYWPNLSRDTKEFARKCGKCQRFANPVLKKPNLRH